MLVDSKGVNAVFCLRILGDQCFLPEQELWDRFGSIEAAICWESSRIVVR